MMAAVATKGSMVTIENDKTLTTSTAVLPDGTIKSC